LALKAPYMFKGPRLGLFGGTRLFPNSNSCCLMSASNLSFKLILVLMIIVARYGLCLGRIR